MLRDDFLDKYNTVQMLYNSRDQNLIKGLIIFLLIPDTILLNSLQTFQKSYLNFYSNASRIGSYLDDHLFAAFNSVIFIFSKLKSKMFLIFCQTPLQSSSITGFSSFSFDFSNFLLFSYIFSFQLKKYLLMIFSCSSSSTCRTFNEVYVIKAWNPFGPSFNIYSLLSISSIYSLLDYALPQSNSMLRFFSYNVSISCSFFLSLLIFQFNLFVYRVFFYYFSQAIRILSWFSNSVPPFFQASASRWSIYFIGRSSRYFRPFRLYIRFFLQFLQDLAIGVFFRQRQDILSSEHITENTCQLFSNSFFDKSTLVRLFDSLSPIMDQAEFKKFYDKFKEFKDLRQPIPSILSILLCPKCKIERLSSPSRFYILLMTLLFRQRQIRFFKEVSPQILEMQLLLSQIVTKLGYLSIESICLNPLKCRYSFQFSSGVQNRQSLQQQYFIVLTVIKGLPRSSISIFLLYSSFICIFLKIIDHLQISYKIIYTLIQEQEKFKNVNPLQQHPRAN